MSYEEAFAGADDDVFGALVASGAFDDDVSGDLVGDIIGDLVGASDLDALMTAAGAAAPARVQNPALAKALQGFKKKAALQKLIRQRQIAGFRPETYNYTQPDYSKARKVPMGFDSVTTIAPGATATITQRPQVPFRPARLMIPSDIAGAILVLDFKVGNKSQLAANGGLPGRMFQEDATDSLLLLDTATPALDVSWIVQNIGGAPIRFIGSASGPAVELRGLPSLLP